MSSKATALNLTMQIVNESETPQMQRGRDQLRTWTTRVIETVTALGRRDQVIKGT